MRRETELGRRLADTVDEEERCDLAEDPWTALPLYYDLEIEVVAEPPAGACGIDGTYDRNGGRVTVADRASDRRMSFTLLHELGHHLLRNDDDCVRHLIELGQKKRKQGPAEELIADAFAAEILIPWVTSSTILGTGTMRARAVAELFAESPASRSACATRAAEQCPGSGYVVVSSGAKLVFAAPFGEQVAYRIRRGTPQPEQSPLAIASTRSTYQATGRLYFWRGTSTPVWNIDAVTTDDGYTFAVCTNERFPGTSWSPPEANRERLEAPDVTCWDCGDVGESWHRCVRCSEFACASCGSCPACRARVPKVREKLCPGCQQIRPLASFPDGEELCDEGVH